MDGRVYASVKKDSREFGRDEIIAVKTQLVFCTRFLMIPRTHSTLATTNDEL